MVKRGLRRSCVYEENFALSRILGIDYGDVRTGLALSDALGLTAVGLKTVRAEGRKKLIAEIRNVVEEYGVTEIVVGDPVNMNGTRGERSEKAQDFAKNLKKELKITVELLDERCTTMSAHVILNETDTCGKKRKAVIDTLSAEIILQNYMDAKKNKALPG